HLRAALCYMHSTDRVRASRLLWLLLPPPPSTRFPYHDALPILRSSAARSWCSEAMSPSFASPLPSGKVSCFMSSRSTTPRVPVRSEEHTFELQSRENRVCRVQLEKKKKQRHDTTKTDQLQTHRV